MPKFEPQNTAMLGIERGTVIVLQLMGFRSIRVFFSLNVLLQVKEIRLPSCKTIAQSALRLERSHQFVPLYVALAGAANSVPL